MRRRVLSLAVALICGLASTTQAADLLEIYDLAVQNDPRIREAEQVLFATREVQPQARALLLPNLAVQGTVDYQSLDVRGVAPDGSRFSRSESFDSQGLQAVVSQTVYNRASWMTLSQTDNILAQAEAQYRDQQIALMAATTEAYFGVLRAADLVTVQASLVRANERQLEQSRQRFEVGLVAITDVNDNLAAFDQSRADLITAENQLDNAWEALRRIVGPIQTPIARLGDALPLTPPEPNDINVWAESAMRGNFGIIAASEAVGAAKKGIEIERSGFYPSVNLQAGYDMARSGTDSRNDADLGFIGLQVNVPIYQGGAVTSRTRQAGYNFRASQDNLDAVRRQVDQQVKDAFRGITSSIADVKARQAAVVSARSSLESTEAGQEVGTRTQVDVLNAQRQLFQAEFEYLSSRYQYIINGILLHQATSTLNRDILARGNAWLDPSDTIAPPAN
ncbi:type I secretion protein TolC [Thiocapsa imhoffii]|uniref:Type I secretion protein TolC n=1 Tax=Thiocapsa imhoffii TaxID=382777 RepID=A0A9X0WIM2_9GAMM|nr:TolC family outer membrane protein [Thiocapsa imhoffii]MBK1644782.1 type I secretion protein TolC [Thiocapsa imhoffii]